VDPLLHQNIAARPTAFGGTGPIARLELQLREREASAAQGCIGRPETPVVGAPGSAPESMFLDENDEGGPGVRLRNAKF